MQNLLILIILFEVLAISQSFVLNHRPQYRSQGTQLQDAKYEPTKFVEVSVKKPLGLELEEVAENKAKGVFVYDIKEGNARATQKISKGLFLLKVNGADVKTSTFDQVMDMLIDHPAEEPLDLTFINPRDIERGPALITIKAPDGSVSKVKALKGQLLRNIVLDTKVELYAGKAKFTNCGGGGSCGSCVVTVLDNPDWEERPAFEAAKLKKYPEKARLSCNTVIEGDATVIVQPPKVE